MWNKINIEGKDYILKINNKDHRFTIMLSDFIQIWCEQVQTEEIILRCKEENPMFEADDETFLNHVMSLVKCENPTDINRSISESEEMLLLKLQTTIEGIKFKFSCRLHKRIPECKDFYENITRPLLMIVQELQTRENTLCSLLAKKDLEINEYKMNGAEITRRSVETQKFDKAAFKEEHLESLKKLCEDQSFKPHDVFVSCTADLYQERAVVNNSAEVKKEITSAGRQSPDKKKRSPSKKKFRSEENSSITEASVPLETIETELKQEEEEVKIKKRKPAFKGLKL